MQTHTKYKESERDNYIGYIELIVSKLRMCQAEGLSLANCLPLDLAQDVRDAVNLIDDIESDLRFEIQRLENDE